MPSISFPWGRDNIEFDFPQQWSDTRTAGVHPPVAPDDWIERISRSMSKPDSGLALGKLISARKNGKIVIVMDATEQLRPACDILDKVLNEVRHAGVSDGQVEILLSTGLRNKIPADTIDKLSSRAGGIRCRRNPFEDDSAYVDISTDQFGTFRVDRRLAGADLRIVISPSNPDLQAGFSGGYMQFFPGCAAASTIRRIHRLGLTGKFTQLIGTPAQQNPMRTAIEDAGKNLDILHGCSFFVQYLPDREGLPAFVSVGQPTSTHRMVSKQCSVNQGAAITNRSDIAIVNAYPRDGDVLQCLETIAAVHWAVKPHGTIICFAECPEGMGEIPRLPCRKGAKIPRAVIKFLSASTIAKFVERVIPKVTAQSSARIHVITESIRRNSIILVCKKLTEQSAAMPGVKIFDSAEMAFAHVRKATRGKKQTVTVFPSGGETFPIILDRPTARAGQSQQRSKASPANGKKKS